MKVLPALIPLLFLTISCNQNDKQKTVSGDTTQTDTRKKDAVNPGPSDPNSVAGDWRMRLNAFDDNSNHVLDPEERQKAVGNRYHLVLNNDGTARLMDLFTGTYTVKTEGSKRVLEVHRKKVEGEETVDPPADRYEITSLTGSEMVLLLMEGESNSFWIFERK